VIVELSAPSVRARASRFARVIRLSDDALDLVHGNPIELCDLRPSHSVFCQGADATELEGRYFAGLTPDRCRSWYRLRLGRRYDLRHGRRRQRRDREDTWLTPGLLASRRRSGIWGGYWHLCTGSLLLWLEQVFSNFASSVDPFVMIAGARRLPFAWQELLQKKWLMPHVDIRS